ncbi:hypothetical protein LTR53_001353 [Teratosphaeriaceae sp. CCFEE 6253]|nr:hypothetical protein LTR53_001353 [Teratosphaeriaceae sp. CCFEE 6253]
MEDMRKTWEQDNVLRQRQKDLLDLQTHAALESKDLQGRNPQASSTSVQCGKRSSVVKPPSATASDDPASTSINTSHVNSTPPQAAPSTVEDIVSLLPSKARSDWEFQKQMEGARSESLDALMDMIGLENVKNHFLEIKARVDLAVRQGTDMKKTRFGTAFLGNPGTGKTTVARLYAKFLASVGAIPGSYFVETTGSKLASEGVKSCRNMVDDILAHDGGALFIDEAYQLTSSANAGGRAILDFLLAEVENLTGKVVFILAGYNKQMESLFAHNPGVPSRFPQQIQFADYEDSELLAILTYGVMKQYKGRMGLEDGLQGLYARVLARRIGRGRGKVGFGNARAIENALSIVYARQAKRIREERRAGVSSDDFLLMKADIIGPKPADVLSSNRAWKTLQGMVGLKTVKDSVQALLHSIQVNYQQELKEEQLVDFSINKVFLGSPGTGKTTVGKLYGRILADIGMLSNGEVLVRTPADFIGNVIGASEANTKGILDAAIGKVLIIDEFYGLAPQSTGSSGDPYRTAVIDIIVAEIQNVPGEDRCILVLGYKEQIEEMMQNANPGLRRRFSPDSGFVFDDFDNAELAVIFDNKLKAIGFKATPKAREVALEMLQRARNRSNFGNAGEIDKLLNDTKMRQQQRTSRDSVADPMTLEAHDFDPDFARGERATTNIAMLFQDVIGCDGIVAQLQGYQRVAANMKALDMDPRDQLPFTFLFRGPPDTGKTSTAWRMGKVYYDLGFLAKAEVVECSAKDLVGEYVGHTGPKTQKLVESALGKVLFIDEAYRLGEGQFAKEAVDELVDCVTKPQFFQKLIIILAGYDNDINRLMDANPGLTSRFPESIDFRCMTPEESLMLLQQLFAKKKEFDSTVLTNPTKSFREQLRASLDLLCSLSNFASARDIQTLAKTMLRKMMMTEKPPIPAVHLPESLVIEMIERMVQERSQRARAAGLATRLRAAPTPQAPPMADQQSFPSDPTTTTAQQSKAEGEQDQHGGAESATAPADDTDDDSSTDSHDPVDRRLAMRDAGVSDEIWNQLQLDKLREEEDAREAIRLQEEEARLKAWLEKCADAKRQRELAELERKRKEMEEKQKRKAMMQQKLMRSGRCPVGYQWIQQASGYRCAGGSHYLSDAQAEGL